MTSYLVFSIQNRLRFSLQNPGGLFRLAAQTGPDSNSLIVNKNIDYELIQTAVLTLQATLNVRYFITIILYFNIYEFVFSNCYLSLESTKILEPLVHNNYA